MAPLQTSDTEKNEVATQQLKRSAALNAQQPLYRFVYETVLTVLFVVLLYVVFAVPEGIQILAHPRSYDFEALIFRLALMSVLISVFFTIAFYGTSFEVTPFRFVIGPVRKFVTRQLPSSLGETVSEVFKNYEEQSEETKDEKTAESNLKTNEEKRRDEAVYRVLHRSAQSAANLADKMERKINTYLILGVAVGILGVGVWYFSFFVPPHGVANTQTTALRWDERLWDFVPRITILLFIELLAGFFLRQYRIGVEDFKYFLELRRRAEANQVAYTVFDLIQDDKLKTKFATGLLEEKSDSHLKKGETTTILEAMKREENMTLQLISVLGDHLENITKVLHKGKHKE